MSFDVALLPGRAAKLKDAAWNAAYREATRFGGSAQGGMRVADSVAAGLESVYDDFLDIPKPEDFTSMITRLQTAMGKLADEGHTQDPVTGGSSATGHNPNLARVASSGDILDDWSGLAAKTYNSTYADQFVPTASSQYAATSVLLNAINAEACVWETVRDDLDKISSDAIDKMNSAADKGGAEWVAALTIAAAVVAIPFTGGGSAIAMPAVAAGLTVVATGISLASDGGTVDEVGLAAGSSDEVKESVYSVLSKLKTSIYAQEDKIHTAMVESSNNIDASWKVFCLPEPDITEAPQHPVNSGDYAGYDE